MRRSAPLRIAAAMVFATLLSGGALAQDQAAPAPSPAPAPPVSDGAAPTQTWSTICSAAARKDAADCAIDQRVVLKQTGQVVGGITIRVPAETRKPVMMVRLPLGLYLPAGASLSVDGGVAEFFPIQTCEADGCYVGSPLTETLLAAMRGGNQLQIAVQNIQKSTVTIPISLVGFTSAYASIE